MRREVSVWREALKHQARCLRPGAFEAEGILIDNHTFVTDAALRITGEFRFLHGCNATRVHIDMAREIFSHEIV